MDIDFQRYLESICNDTYSDWQDLYTPIDALERQRNEPKKSRRPLDLGLMVQTIQPTQGQAEAPDIKIERLNVLEGLRKYAVNHVLLLGRPGSGKSTALEKLLWEKAQQKRPLPQPLPETGRGVNSPPSLAGKGAGGLGQIPVLLELRQYKTSILDLIQNFLQRHNLPLEIAEIKTLLYEKQFLLLIDGVNELPNEAARQDLNTFRQNHRNTPMIFTTREGMGGDLGIEKKLEMQPLTEGQMQQFVRTYLSDKGEEMLQRLGEKLRDFAQTPLLLWMLCELFRQTGDIPPNLGLVFRCFAQGYNQKFWDSVQVSDEFRRWLPDLLQHLAFTMMQGETPTEFRVTIDKREAELILTKFLEGKIDYPPSLAKEWLEELLKHHLIQFASNNQIQFRHQLLQEYYAAEYLLPQISNISDKRLQRDYLNYLKWTQTLALMLALVNDEAQVARVVKLAIDVDLMLGARLAGEVKKQFQEKPIDLIQNLDIHQLVKIEFLGITRSESAVDILLILLQNEDSAVRCTAANALGKIGNSRAVDALIYILKQDENRYVRRTAANALGKIGNCAAVNVLIQALQEDQDSYVKWNAANALDKMGYDAEVNSLMPDFVELNILIKSFNFNTRSKDNVIPLMEISNDAEINILLQALTDQDLGIRWNAEDRLIKISKTETIETLWQIHSNNPSRETLDIIFKIQERCKFYNHKIFNSPPPEGINTSALFTGTLDMQSYEEILSVISYMSIAMERDPKTFSRLGEEALRQHFLVHLNGRYKGQATGETFNRDGKTDILIRVEGKNIFIAECKFWGGSKLFKETLDQLLGYTTWRDTKLAMLIFNRNKNFSDVLKQIPEEVKKHPNFLRELTYQSKMGFRFVIHHPDDKQRELTLTVLAFNIPQ